jgi:hypothetical protein
VDPSLWQEVVMDDENPRKRIRLSSPENKAQTTRVNQNEAEKEARVGIDRFVVSEASSFTGVLKQR